MTQIKWASQSYLARSRQLLSQQCVNAFTEPTPKEAKTEVPVYGIPGLSLFSRMGNGPIIGLHVMGDNLFVLSGPGLWKIAYADVLAAPSGSPVVATFIGTTTLGNIASMADNGAQLVMVDGNVGWIYQPGGLYQVTTANAPAGATSVAVNQTGTITMGDTIEILQDNGTVFTTTASATSAPTDNLISWTDPIPSALTAGATIQDSFVELAQITAPAFMPASTVRYFDGYFVFNARNTRLFFISGLNDGTQYSGLDFATASAGSDYTVAVEIYHEQLLVFCRVHTEVWWDAGALAFPFQRYDAALIARGLASPYAVSSEDNTVLWMGDDGIYYRLNGFNPQRISTFAMETAWAEYPLRFTDASGFVLDQQGHKFAVLNFPSGNATWCYDISSGLWHERESFGTAWV